jgi:hypothetical protein
MGRKWVVASEASSPANPLYNRTDALSPPSGQRVMVLTPGTASKIPYDAAHPAPLVIYHHGAGEVETALLADGRKTGIVHALLDAGFILAGTAAFRENWGCQRACDAYADLHAFVKSHFAIGPVIYLSQSMGGFTGLLCLAQNKIPGVAGWAGIYPACNLRNLYDLKMLTAEIRTAYGISADNSNYDAKTAAHDPVLLEATAFTGARMRFYASYGDTVVPRAENTDKLAALVRSTALESQVIACKGNHGDKSHFQPDDLISFFKRCLEP